MLWHEVGQQHFEHNKNTQKYVAVQRRRKKGSFVLCHGVDVTKQIGNDGWMHVK